MQIYHFVGTAAPAVDAYTLTTGRAVATAGALVALAGLIIGGLALARAIRRIGDNGRRGAIVALVAGAAGLVSGAVVVALAKGGPGTGYGIVGGFAALAIGPLAMVFGWLALARSRPSR